MMVWVKAIAGGMKKKRTLNYQIPWAPVFFMCKIGIISSLDHEKKQNEIINVNITFNSKVLYKSVIDFPIC